MKLPNNIDYYYSQILRNSKIKLCMTKIYFQTSGIAQGGCFSSMLADLFLYYYEYNHKNNNLQLYKYIDDILISIHNVNCLLPVKYPTNSTLTCNNLINMILYLINLHIQKINTKT